MPYFILNNIISTDYLTIETLPSIVRATKDIEKKEVLGRDGFLTHDHGSYRSTVKNVVCWIKNLDNLDLICSWLTGSGDVVFSNEPEKVYEFTIINQIDFSKIIREFHKFIITFECQPKKKNIDNPLITLESAGTIFNSGTAISKPIIKVYGNGNIDLNINGNIINLTNVSEYVTLDSNLQDSFKGLDYKNYEMNGKFPLLKTENNNISWTGTVDKVEITPNWRWL